MAVPLCSCGNKSGSGIASTSTSAPQEAPTGGSGTASTSTGAPQEAPTKGWSQRKALLREQEELARLRQEAGATIRMTAGMNEWLSNGNIGLLVR